ncbi:MAG: aldolase/citrate lyase family protein [Planctomycetaceae bacterium]
MRGASDWRGHWLWPLVSGLRGYRQRPHLGRRPGRKARAAENIDSIVKVPGIDAVLLGPYDLSASLGQTGKLDHPSVVAAIDRITSVCQAANMPLGYFGVTAAAVKPFMDRGYTLIVAGVDTLLLGVAAKRCSPI